MLKKRIIGILILIAIIVGMIFVWLNYGNDLVSFVLDKKRFGAWVDSVGIWGKIAFVGMVMLQVLVALLPGGPFEIAAGYAFGTLQGTILYVLGATLASILIMILVRIFGKKFILLFISEQQLESVKFINDSKKLGRVLFVFFLVPGTPKDPITYAVGLTKLKMLPWIFINIVGRFPAAYISVLCGSALEKKNYVVAIAAIAAVVILCVLGTVGYVMYRKKKKASEESEHASKEMNDFDGDASFKK